MDACTNMVNTTPEEINETTITLIPFEGPESSPPWSIVSRISLKSDGILHITWNLSGPIRQRAVIPKSAESPSRLDGLWRHTCFECFLSLRCEESYWELNASPSGDWALYRLSDYRAGMVDEDGPADELAVDVRRGDGGLSASIRINLADILPGAKSPWELRDQLVLSPTAVLELTDGSHIFFARVHPKEEPDFHDRGAFATIEDMKPP